MRVGGVVLCGGQSSRMGRPKAWLPFAGELMLPRVVRLLGEAVGPIVVVAGAGAGPRRRCQKRSRWVRDPESGLGPLQGLAVGLLEGKAEAAYTTSCDVPFLDPAFVRDDRPAGGSRHRRAGGGGLSAPAGGGVSHRRGGAARPLGEGKSRPAGLFAEVPTRVVTADEIVAAGLTLDALRNVNTPEEYAAQRKEWARGGDGWAGPGRAGSCYPADRRPRSRRQA